MYSVALAVNLNIPTVKMFQCYDPTFPKELPITILGLIKYKNLPRNVSCYT